MKKIIILLIMLTFIVSAAIASTLYYTTRNGEVLEVGSNLPIPKNIKSNLVCNTISFSYGMNTFYMVKDDGSPYSRRSLVGCEDYAITNIFDSLILLNDDKVLEKLTADELKKANIRFVKQKTSQGGLYINNKKQDFNLNNIAYIDLSKLKYTSKNYGEVKMYLRPAKENSYYGSSSYMREITIKIQSKTKRQADRII